MSTKHYFVTRVQNIFRMCFLCILASCGAEVKENTQENTQKSTVDRQAIVKGQKKALLSQLTKISHKSYETLFGAHQAEISIQTKIVSQEKEALVFEEIAKFSVSKDNNIEVIYENSKNAGFSLYQIEQNTLMANRYGPVRPTPAETFSRLRENTFRSAWEQVFFAAPFLSFTPKKPEQSFLDRKSLLFEISLVPGETPKIHEKRSIKIKQISGTLLLDEETLLPLQTTLSLQFYTEEDGVDIEVFVSLSQGISEISSEEIVIEVPEALPSIDPRFRISKEREVLLGKENPPKSVPNTP